MDKFCPVKSSNDSKSIDPSLCPVKGQNTDRYKNPNQYNVYSQKIDTTNNMPTNLVEPLNPDSERLPNDRVTSNIPKGGTYEETWKYPSPRMFYNALVRKNKLEGVEVEDIETVVSIHNNMNENTWSQILAWEALNKKPNTPVELEPKLLRFTGRPDDLSPKAQLKMLFGHTKPFDRHDWIVDRGGKEVRYVIDYYHDESRVNDDKRPTHLNDVKSMKSIKVDVRPALDSLSSFYDYFFKMPLKYTAGNAGAYNPPSFFPAPQIKRAEETRKIQISNMWTAVKKDCAGCKDNLASCSNETDCQSASVALQLCMARIVCPDIANKFDTSVANFKKTKVMDESINESFSSVVKCLENFELESKRDF